MKGNTDSWPLGPRPVEEFYNCEQERKDQREKFKSCLEKYWKLVDKKMFRIKL